ncbi:unnamed protein product [Arctogadus glacialis]
MTISRPTGNGRGGGWDPGQNWPGQRARTVGVGWEEVGGCRGSGSRGLNEGNTWWKRTNKTEKEGWWEGGGQGYQGHAAEREGESGNRQTVETPGSGWKKIAPLFYALLYTGG